MPSDDAMGECARFPTKEMCGDGHRISNFKSEISNRPNLWIFQQGIKSKTHFRRAGMTRSPEPSQGRPYTQRILNLDLARDLDPINDFEFMSRSRAAIAWEWFLRGWIMGATLRRLAACHTR
jgi:hypothetical protein